MSDQNILGELAPAEINQMQQIQTQVNSCITQIGQLELRKAALLGQVARLEAQGQATMGGIAERLGIPQETPWHVTPEGKVQAIKLLK